MTKTFVLYDESLGKDFKLYYDPENIANELREYIDLGTVDESGDCDEYPIGDDGYGNTISVSDRKTDIDHIKNLIEFFERSNPEDLERYFSELIDNQPKKKNGSFSKGRVNDIETFSSFGLYWEDSYGWNTPALRIRTIDDYECRLVVETYIVKY